jgi:hypothetical protein
MKKTIWQFAILSILALTLTSAEWGQDSHAHANPSAPDSKWSELLGSMHAMHLAMTSLQPTGDNDADFVRLMLPTIRPLLIWRRLNWHTAKTLKCAGWRRRSSPTSNQKSS